MGSNVQLSPAHLKEVLSILNCFVPEVDVWVYGSRANGTAHSTSDLDLLLSPSPSGLARQKIDKLKNAFTESNLPFFVDVFDQSTMDPGFYQLIEPQKHLLKPAKKHTS